MGKNGLIYECSNCGAQSPKWAGQCGECGKWNTLVEEVGVPQKIRSSQSKDRIFAKLHKLSEIEGKQADRVSTLIGELDRVLGGGLVPGEVVLMIGEPGIGKSTLLTQLAIQMGQINNNQAPITKQTSKNQLSNNINNKIGDWKLDVGYSTRSVVYVCGEESPSQVKLRVERMQGSELPKSSEPNLKMLAETNVDSIFATLDKEDISLLIIDSVQTLYSSDLPGLAGSISQIRECTARLIGYAKSKNVPIVLVGHVTKDGEMAGPKVLEHMVDAVLELTGDRYYDLRLLRTQKNRFGATDEVGVFRMLGSGMEEVTNPSEVFTLERQENVPGSCLAVVLEGTRPVIVEVQALVVDSELPVPRRVAQGVDIRRVQIILGVLQKHARLPLGTKDVFVKVTGGLTIKEPAADLAIAMAVASSVKNKAVGTRTVAIGEVGLLGEIRSASYMDKRMKEARRLGYTEIFSRDKSRLVSEVVKL